MDTVLLGLGEAVDLQTPDDDDTSAFLSILGAIFDTDALTSPAPGPASSLPSPPLVDEPWGVSASTETALLSRLRTGLTTPRAERGPDDLLAAAVMLRILSSQASLTRSAAQTLVGLHGFLYAHHPQPLAHLFNTSPVSLLSLTLAGLAQRLSLPSR
eukprot:m.36193 g.36193  ORF g.36193 m.36193 type:complete len:157 (+) comp9640_c0_seq4:303-773(+)